MLADFVPDAPIRHGNEVVSASARSRHAGFFVQTDVKSLFAALDYAAAAHACYIKDSRNGRAINSSGLFGIQGDSTTTT